MKNFTCNFFLLFKLFYPQFPFMSKTVVNSSSAKLTKRKLKGFLFTAPCKEKDTKVTSNSQAENWLQKYLA